jgi:hypothetical protein
VHIRRIGMLLGQDSRREPYSGGESRRVYRGATGVSTRIDDEHVQGASARTGSRVAGPEGIPVLYDREFLTRMLAGILNHLLCHSGSTIKPSIGALRIPQHRQDRRRRLCR